MRNICIVALLLFAFLAKAEPPKAPEGYKWVLIENLSDEFNGNELDSDKWYNYHPWWKGRPPAKFVKEAVSVKNGYLQIKNGVLDKPDGKFKYSGGAVVSKATEAIYGSYFECKAKASKTRMSTTFWMSNRGTKLETTDCKQDSYSLELDIQECIGDGHKWEKFKTSMNSNTHYWYRDCDKQKQTRSVGSQMKLDSEVSEDFHIYGAWWKDETEVTFYADDKEGETVQFNTEFTDKPFDRPMHINMVTETYSWEAEPRVEVLTDNSKNTSYYDWVRSWKLVKINQ